MPPRGNRPSLDGVNRSPAAKRLQPDYRPDHELPAPPRQDLIRAHEHEAGAQTESPQAQPAQTPASDPRSPGQNPAAAQTAQELSEELKLNEIKDHEHAPKSRKKAWIIGILVTLLVLIGAVCGAAYGWYQSQLAPVSTDTSKHIRVTIDPGTTPAAIAEQLEVSGVIKSKIAFTIYTKLSKTENNLKAGTYNFQPSLSTQAIVDHLVEGKQDTFDITFLPGDTLASNRQKIIDLGYDAADVDKALKKTYDRPLFATKPATADLEGYIFGDTYELDASATPESILGRTFDEFEAVIKENDLVNGFKKQGLTLYEGITLASIIQKEVSDPDDSRQVAQVFFKRLKEGMPLGADATFVYAAKKAGAQPSVDFESRYNTRKYGGLPPGPISAPGIAALKAVANPAPGDFVYFVSGDDGKTHFSRTINEHEQKTRTYCIKNCSLF